MPNDEKTSCCYICQSRLGCVIKCKYLGTPENEPSKVEPEKSEAENTSKTNEKSEVNQTENPPVACSFCNIEMSQTKTKFKINGWKGPPSTLSSDESSVFGQELPLIVYCCPQCGKISFRVDGGPS
jgi:hypothetical protein